LQRLRKAVNEAWGVPGQGRPALQLKPGCKKREGQEEHERDYDRKGAEDNLAEEPALPAQHENHQKVEKAHEDLGKQTDLEQLNQENLRRIEKFLKVTEEIEQEEQQGEDEEKHNRPGDQPVQRG
jgi:hypothetical protein